MSERILPTVDDTNRPFWDGCREGVLRLQRCTACGHLRYPISRYCPRCLSESTEWEAVDGRGSVYSFGVFRHGYNDAWRDRVPYVVALVQLDAGPTLISTIDGLTDLPVTTGTVTYAGRNGVPDKDVVILTVEGGEPAFVEAMRPEYVAGS